MRLSLEQNLLDIKSMESNQNIHNVLVESSKATHTLKINVDEFENVADKVRDNVDNLREINDIIGDFNSDVLNNEDLEKELNELQIAGEKNKQYEEVKKIEEKEEEKRLSQQEKMGISKLFPNANRNNIIMNELDVNNKGKEGFEEGNSFQMILEELNKK
jgi:hypothetical protein